MTLIFNTIIPLFSMGIMNYLIYKSMKKRNMSLNRSQSMTVGNRSQITAAAGQADLTGTSNINTGKRRHSARYLRHQLATRLPLMKHLTISLPMLLVSIIDRFISKKCLLIHLTYMLHEKPHSCVKKLKRAS